MAHDRSLSSPSQLMRLAEINLSRSEFLADVDDWATVNPWGYDFDFIADLFKSRSAKAASRLIWC